MNPLDWNTFGSRFQEVKKLLWSPFGTLKESIMKTHYIII